MSPATRTTVATDRVPVKSRRKVRHLFDEKELRMASEVGGLVLVAFCGREKKCGERGPGQTVNVVGRLMVDSEPFDCKACVRNFEAQLRRQLRQIERFQRLNDLSDK